MITNLVLLENRLPGVEVKIASDGEILARGPNIMKGYYKKKKETEETVINGWLHTGDIGAFDSEGLLDDYRSKKTSFQNKCGQIHCPIAHRKYFPQQ
jgi:long-chain acyl-CoA synthetase